MNRRTKASKLGCSAAGVEFKNRPCPHAVEVRFAGFDTACPGVARRTGNRLVIST